MPGGAPFPVGNFTGDVSISTTSAIPARGAANGAGDLLTPEEGDACDDGASMPAPLPRIPLPFPESLMGSGGVANGDVGCIIVGVAVGVVSVVGFKIVDLVAAVVVVGDMTPLF